MKLETIRFLQRLVGEHVHIGPLGAVIEELEQEEALAILRLANEADPLPKEA